MRIDYHGILKQYLIYTVKKILNFMSKNDQMEFCVHISFQKNYPGTMFTANIEEQTPTIVLQHRFWNLEVDEKGFGVTIDMDGDFHDIYIPYKAITLFYDPQADFVIDFCDLNKEEMEEDEDLEEDKGVISIDFSRIK